MGSKKTAVALTTTVQSTNSKLQQDLAATFLALLEVHVSQSPTITVVERTQPDLALQELVRSRGLNVDPRDTLQLGQLARAELILNAQFLSADEATGRHRMLIRIVEAKAGRIRGIAVAPADELTIDEAALQVARYLSGVIESPHQAAVTVAVGAFESVGRFDRLRPLELAVRDMLTTGLVNVSRFQVLQRSDMKQQLLELELIQAGLANREDLPETVPRRGAAYLVTGTLDERTADGQHRVLLEGRIVHARSGKTVHEFQFATAPDELPAALTRYAIHIAAFLTKASELPALELRQPRGRSETKLLLNQVLADLYRFRRLSPIDSSHRSFRVPGIQPVLDARQRKLRTLVKADTRLGRHLLRKSIDSLEALLYIQPDHPVATYALGYCYAFHIDGICQPDRGDVLLHKAFAGDSDGELGSLALRDLSEMSYHHANGRISPMLRRQAAKQLRFAFEQMPAKHQTYQWARSQGLLIKLYSQQKDFASLANTMDSMLAMVDQIDDASARRTITMSVGRFAVALCLAGGGQATSKEAARSLLTTWAASEDKIRHHTGSLGLATIAASDHDYLAAADWYQQASETYVERTKTPDGQARDNLLMHAARNLRKANKPADALRLLTSIEPTSSRNSLDRGYRDIELGICLALLGEKDKALRMWVTAAEEVPSLVDNSDVVDRIEAIGGVPLRQDRDIDVRYLKGPTERNRPCRALATDGRWLFRAGGPRDNNVLAYDIKRDSWKTIGQGIGRVTCLAYAEGALWVGTAANGLWCSQPVGNAWRHWSSEQGLPDQHIESLAVYGRIAFAGVGTAASGGLVRVDPKHGVHIFEGKDAPTIAPTHVIVGDDTIQARTLTSVYEYNNHEQKWKPLARDSSRWCPSIHQGESTIWASRYGAELYGFDESGEINDDYQQTWFPPGQGKSGYLVKFLIEREGHIWFGGSPWARFRSSGLYRVDKRTGDFAIYGPRDGFKTSGTYEIYDGIWAADRLWLATSGGLAEIAPRKSADRQSSR